MTVAQKRENNTNNFLRSYLMQKDLKKISGYDEPDSWNTSADIEAASVADFNTDLHPGQIRLLADLDQITYILLLRRWEEDAFVVTAFSHYDFPATDEEMMLEGNRGSYLNTLQIWNTRTLRDDTLKRSWLCGNLPEDICLEAWEFWTSFINGKKLSDHILQKSGTPISAADDIRLEYMREEMAAFAGIDASDLIDDEKSATSVSIAASCTATKVQDNWPEWLGEKYMLPPLWKNDAEILAAGDEKENIHINCHIYERDELVAIDWSPAEKSLWINIFNSDKSNFSSALDNAKIINASGNILGIIKNGQCKISRIKNFDGTIGILDADNTIYTFIPEE